MLALLLCACAGGESPLPRYGPAAHLQPVHYGSVPGWQKGGIAGAIEPFRRSCAALAANSADRSMPVFAGDIAAWRAACADLPRVGAGEGEARRYFEAWFQPYRLVDGGDSTGLLTGYYEPELRGSWTRSSVYRYPLYRPPRRIAAPAPSRREIDAGALAGQGLEILWLDDPIDSFFLHIQGSGRVRMDNGEVVRVGYAGKNGQPYVAIGAELVRRGALTREEVSLQTIKGWLRANPGEAPGVMALNASYVFFRQVTGDGPIGSQGVALTADRSVAVDRSYVPLGVPYWVDSRDPLAPDKPMRMLTIAQDTGGAIKGPIRADLFCGAGLTAEERAGRMKEPLFGYVLLPKDRPETRRVTVSALY